MLFPACFSLTEIKWHRNMLVSIAMMIYELYWISRTNGLIASKTENHVHCMIHLEMIDCIWATLEMLMATYKWATCHMFRKTPLCYLTTTSERDQIIFLDSFLIFVILRDGIHLMNSERQKVTIKIRTDCRLLFLFANQNRTFLERIMLLSKLNGNAIDGCALLKCWMK